MFTPDEIDRMSPAVKEELQLRELMLHQYRQRVPASERRRAHSGQVPTRRGNNWGRVWNVHDPDQAYLREVRKAAKVATQEGVSEVHRLPASAVSGAFVSVPRGTIGS